MTILQSWSQGVEVWGESRMRELWSASNVKAYNLTRRQETHDDISPPTPAPSGAG